MNIAIIPNEIGFGFGFGVLQMHNGGRKWFPIETRYENNLPLAIGL